MAMSLSILLGSTGCSAFQPKMQSVTVSSLPSGANIEINGQRYGPAPVTMELERNKDHTIVATSGTRSAVRNLDSKFSKTGILDVIGGIFFLVPLIGLATPGAWELDSTNVVMQVPQG